MVLPALNFDASPMAGWRLAALSITGIALFVFEPRIALELKDGQALACVLGALANLLFVCAYFAMLARRYLVIDQPSYAGCKLLAWLAVAATLGALIPLTIGDKVSVSIGYVLWVGSATMLAFATIYVSRTEMDDELRP